MSNNELFSVACQIARGQFSDDKRYFDHRDDATEETSMARNEQDLHARTTELRFEMGYGDLTDALDNASQEVADSIVEAAKTYDNLELGNLISRQIQNYFRSMADTVKPDSFMLRKQAD